MIRRPSVSQPPKKLLLSLLGIEEVADLLAHGASAHDYYHHEQQEAEEEQQREGIVVVRQMWTEFYGHAYLVFPADAGRVEEQRVVLQQRVALKEAFVEQGVQIYGFTDLL